MKDLLLTLLVVSLVVAIAPAGALGQGNEYDEARIEAARAYNEERYDDARRAFERAHRLRPSARTLRGIGMAASQQRDYLGALRALEASLRSEVSPLSERHRTHVQRLLTEVREQLIACEFTLTPTDVEAELLVDGEPAQYDESGALLLAPGVSTIEVRAEGFVSATRTVTALSRRTPPGPIRLELSPVYPENDPAVDEAGEAEEAEEATPERPLGPLLTIWTGAFVGVAGLSVFGLGIRDINVIEDAVPEDELAWTVVAHRQDRGPRRTQIGGAFALVGLAAVAGGLVWLIVSRDEDSANPEAPEVSVRLTPGSVSLDGTF